VQVEYDGEWINVRHGYAPSLWYSLACIDGAMRVMKAGKKVHRIPAASKPQLIEALRQALPGQVGWSNKGGLFRVSTDPKVTCWSLAQTYSEEAMLRAVKALETATARLAQSDRPDVRAHGEELLMTGFAAAVGGQG